MRFRPSKLAVVGVGIAYLVALGWAMGNVSYDVWGVLIVVPIYAVVGLAIIRRMFPPSLHPVAVAVSWGLVVKLGGSFARYWVGFEAYGGGIDAKRYHAYAVEAAGKVWSGEASFVTVIPSGTGTEFLERFTAFVYTLTGGSQLAGFVTFAFFAYVGLLFFVKAATIAVPTMATRRYAWLCVLFPSIVYWPSSIGKEAAIMLGLGVATYGIAAMLTYGRWFSSIVVISCGLGLAALIRPHVAGIWLAALLSGFMVALLFRGGSRRGNGPARANKVGLAIALAIAVVAFGVVAAATLKFLDPGSEIATDTSSASVTSTDPLAADGEDLGQATSESLTQIFEETARRTGQAGSNFVPPSVSNPLTWPYAVTRTLTRPLPFEARGVAQLVSAAEMVALLGVYALSLRRLRNLPRLFISNPYVAFVVTVLFLAGLAYSSLANLGILTRQKSLLIPFLLLLPCLPERTWTKPDSSTAIRHKQITSLAPGTSPVHMPSANSPDDIWA